MPSSGGQTCALDRKSTRLNSSHTIISYAVFCLKKEVGWPEEDGRAGVRRPEQCLCVAVVGLTPMALSSFFDESAQAGVPLPLRSFIFFKNTGTPEISPLPLPDSLPI